MCYYVCRSYDFLNNRLYLKLDTKLKMSTPLLNFERITGRFLAFFKGAMYQSTIICPQTSDLQSQSRNVIIIFGTLSAGIEK